MSNIMYSKVNDMLDVELAMSRMLAQCDMTLDYISASSDSAEDKIEKITWSLMIMHDLIAVVEKQANELQDKE